MNKKHIIDTVCYILFTNRCRLCGKVIDRHKIICDECENGDFYIKDEICYLCGFKKTDCVCKNKKHSYSAVCAPFYYKDGAREAVLRMKKLIQLQNAEYLAEKMAECVRERYADVDFDEIAFVPLSKKQKRKRDEDQSEILAVELSKQLNIPVRRYLVKLFDTKQQHTLKESLRSGNVLGIFDAAPVKEKGVYYSPEGKIILLCDDVKTTGATLNECAKMLKLAGAKDVKCVTATITKKQVDKSK